MKREDFQQTLAVFILRATIVEELPGADLRVPREFLSWIDSTPAARKILWDMGYKWRSHRKQDHVLVQR
jgi:hypothetical protein